MGMETWRQTLEHRNERFEGMAHLFGVDLDHVATGATADEFGRALSRCLTCGSQTACAMWREKPGADGAAYPDFCPNAAFLDAYSTRQKPVRTSQSVWQRVRTGVEIFRAVVNCTAAVKSGRRPPSSDLKGLGIDPATFTWQPRGNRCTEERT